MKNRILATVIITVLFAMILLTSSFTILINFKETENTKEMLKNVNYLISQSKELELSQIEKINDLAVNNSKIRITLIDRNGDMLYDNESNTTENHSDRIEVKNAFENGQDSQIRNSNTLGVRLIYYATKINDNLVIRTSVPISTAYIVEKYNVTYFIAIVIVVIIVCLIIAFRLVRMIVQPIKELESVTLKMSNGNYKIRSSINTNDELGTLSNSFNNMAEQLQAKIREVLDKQNKLETILKSMDNGVIAVDHNNNIISINPYAEKLLGIKISIVGKYIFDYVTDYDIKSFLEDADKNEIEVKILHPIERELKIKKSNMSDGEKRIGKVITIQDITDMKRVQLMRSQFVANVSHELKTPLTSIKGFAETLKMVEDKETRDKFLGIINKEAERLTRLINDILELSNIESNLVESVDEFMPDSVIKEVVNMIKKNAETRNVEIIYNEENCEDIIGDKDKFYQLVLNLVENAVKYSKDTGKVIINSYNDEKYYCLDVIDNGIGIPKEDISRIFERFYRVDKSRKKGGTGLGLSIVKHIVKIFNGQIAVESELGSGSTFKVRIPYI